MSEFDEFAADLGRQHDEKQSAHEAERRKRREDRDQLHHVGRVQLQGVAMPILEDASRAFTAKGLRVEIKNTWDAGSPLDPGISFQVFGQKQRGFADGKYEVAGEIVGVMHDGNALSVTLAPHRHNPFPGRVKVGSDPDAVREAVKRALTSLYEMLDPKKD